MSDHERADEQAVPDAIYAVVFLAEVVFLARALIHSWRTRRDVGIAMAAVFLFTLLNLYLMIVRFGFPMV